MNSSENYAKVLLIKHHRDIFEYPLLKPSYPELLHSDTFEFSVPLNLFEVTLLLELFRAPLVEQVTKHELYLHVELSVILGFLPHLDAEVADIVELHLLLAVSDHERPRVERVQGLVYLCGDNRVVVQVATLLHDLLLAGLA